MTENKDGLSCARAVFDACFGDGVVSYYPRLNPATSGAAGKLDTIIVKQVNAELDTIDPTTCDEKRLDVVLERACASLKEVKDLTEYQDEKASRLLTIMTFLSALAGVSFARFADAYPVTRYLYGPYVNLPAVTVVLCYVAFGMFILLAFCGALVLFYATRTRFKWPSIAIGDESSSRAVAKSRLFYDGILAVTPASWARGFCVQGSAPSQFAPGVAIKLAYAKDYILESYLVAAKVADKLRYMTPGQDLLFYSLRALFVWVLLFAAVSITIP